MESAVITATLTTPVALRGDAILDGIIAGEIAGFDASAPARQTAVDQAQSLFRVRETPHGRVTACSSALVETLGYNIHITKIRRFRFDAAVGIAPDEDIERILMTTHSNATRNLLNPLHATAARAAHWVVAGDVDGILAALRHVGTIGHRRQDGLGGVESWDATPIPDHADSGFAGADGLPVRPLPVEDWNRNAPRSVAAIRPYYYEAPKIECAVPARRLVRFADEVFAAAPAALSVTTGTDAP